MAAEQWYHLGNSVVERRLRLDDKDRRILLQAIYVYFRVKVPNRKKYENTREYADLRAAYGVAYAIYMTRTGRRANYQLHDEYHEVLSDLRKWSEEVTYKPKPMTEEEQAEANAIIARIRGH